MSSTKDNIITLLENQVKSSPDQIAIDEDGRQQITYGMLWRQAKIIADTLIQDKKKSTGLGLVAICLDRSPSLVFSAWGVLMSAQAYIFLDPDDAVSRNQRMIEAFGVTTIITSQSHAQNFAAGTIALNIVEDLLSIDPMAYESIATLPVIDPSSTAYVLQTSGSSGRPKGVIISHRAALPGVEAFSLDGNTRWLFLFNPIHSASQRLIIGVFCKGGTLCIVPKDRFTQLSDVLRENRIEALGITPSLLSKTLEPTRLPPCLRQITSISEPLPQSLADRFAGRVELCVAYGLSEVAQLNIKRVFSKGEKSNLLALPSDSTEVKILMPGTNQEVPAGEPGELCFLGPQVADGYLNNPEQTNKSFKVNPFGHGKMLRTGDEAVVTAGGFTITGRLDDMVKINGQKVEPGEVQAALEAHPNVTQACVVVVELQGARSHVASVQLAHFADWDETKLGLMSLARQNLPSYMIPQYWKLVEEIPRTRAGKIDKQSLIAQISTTHVNDMRLRSSSQGDKPWDEIESAIRNAFANVLHMSEDSIGRDASFPDLGGDSMQAFEVIDQLRTRGYHLSLDRITTRRESIHDLRKSLSEIPITPPASSPRLADKEEFPLTEFQASLIRATMDHGSTDYTYQRLWHAQHIDMDRLEQSFRQIPSLNMTVVDRDTGLFQRPSPAAAPLSIKRVKGGSLRYYLDRDRAEGFKYGAPFSRFAHFADPARGVSVLVETRHHVLFDLFSSSFVYHDASRLYLDRPLHPRPSYRRFVEYMAHKDWRATEAFWTSRLAGAEPCQLNTIPTTGSQSATRTVHDNIKRAADIHGVTEGSIVNAAWAVVLGKQTGATNVVFGTTFSGRDEPIEGLQAMDGPTLAVAPFRLSLDGKLRQTIRRAQTVLSDTLGHCQYGLGRILKAGAAGADLFDTLVNFVHVENTDVDLFRLFGSKPRWKTEYIGLTIERYKTDRHNIRYDLNLTGNVEQKRLDFLADQFVNAIESMISEANRDLYFIGLMSKTEIAQLASPREFPDGLSATLLSAFYESVRSYPRNCALQFENHSSWTYEDVDRDTSRVAHWLMEEHYVGPGQFVGVMFDKSAEAIVTILSILKTGAAFVSVNPESPSARKQSVIQDAQIRIILTLERLRRQEELDAKVLAMDSQSWDCRMGRECRFSTPVYPRSDSYAYAICTSGSTGTPKVVPVTHRAAAASTDSLRKFEQLCSSNKYLHFSDYAFDVLIAEIFPILGAGGTLCIVSEANRLTGLAQQMDEMEVTHATLVPTVAHDLLQQMPQPRKLMHIILAGESPDQELIGSWIGRGCRVVQGYGPAEAAIASNLRVMKPGDLPSNVGQPTPTVQQYILEPQGNGLVPYGAVGELCIAGPQLGRGYLARDDATRAAFVNVKLGGRAVDIYRTGDLARWLPGGEVQLLGRRDAQIKINGRRIELGEIEHVFRSSQLVEQCAAMTAQVHKQQQIIIYVVFHPDEARDIRQLKSQLWAEVSSSLMAYMVPRFLIPTAHIPLLDSTKVNRKQMISEFLRLAEQSEQLGSYLFDGEDTEGDELCSPKHCSLETDQERALARFWAETLNISSTRELHKGSHFLVHGGDSMAANALSRRCSRQGYHLPTRAILKHHLLADMAAKMELIEVRVTRDSREREIKLLSVLPRYLSLSESSVEYCYRCLPGQAEFLSQGAKDRTWVLQTMRRIPQDYDLSLLHSELVALTQQNDVLRTTFVIKDNQWYGIVLNKDHFRPDIKHQSVENRAERDRAVEKIYNGKFVFPQPFVAYHILEQPDYSELVIKLDHGVYDGTLLKILSSQSNAMWNRDTSLVNDAWAPPTPFKDLVLYAPHGLDKERKAAMQYFRTRRPSKLRFFDITNPDANGYFSAPKTIPGLKGFARSAGVTIPVVIQAAFQIVLSSLVGHEEVSFESIVGARHLQLRDQPAYDTSNANGPCANFIPMSIEVTGSLKDHLRNTNVAFREASDHAVLDLHTIYAGWGLNREANQNQVIFLYQPFSITELWMFRPLGSGTITESGTQSRQWGSSEGLETKIRKPYVLAVEGCEQPREEDKIIKISYDKRLFGHDQAKCFGDAMWEVVDKMMQRGLDSNIQDISPSKSIKVHCGLL